MKYIGVFITMIFILSSCEDYFAGAEMPSDRLTENITSNKELEKFTVSAYWAWQGYHEGIYDLGIMIPSFVSDEGILSEDNDQNIIYGNHDQLYLRETGNYSIPYLEYAWHSGYQTSRMANFVLNHLHKNGPFNDSEIHWEDRIMGECYFNRAFAFYNLAKIFCPPYDVNGNMEVPGIICDTTNTTGPYDTRAVSTVSKVYSQILSDLKNAIYYLPEQYEEGRDPLGYQDRAKKDAARFLLARVYFQMGQAFWEKSLEQINLVLENNKYPLDSDPENTYIQSGLGNIGTETVFQYASYSSKSNWHYPRLYHYFGGGSGSGRRKMFHMNKQFAEFINWDNETTKESDLRYHALFRTISGDIWADRWKKRGYSLPVMRAPELHLTRAVICLLTGIGGGNAQAIEDLNIVRQRAYGENYTPLDDNYSTQELLDITHRERAIELFFEGDRLYYIQALRGEVGPGERQDQSYLPYNSDRLYWPIPESEINTNPNINN